MVKRGQLILIEGLDRSGKSTQVAKLHELIPNSKVIKFPDRSTNIGGIINEYLTNKSFSLPDQAIHLLFSANRWELNQTIRNELQNGTTVILDRYIYSGIAYSLAKLKMNNTSGEMADVQWLLNPDKGLPKPDITLFLTLELDEIKKRAEFGDERYENLQFQTIVKANFLSLLDNNDKSIKFIDVNGKGIDQVTGLIQSVITEEKFNQLTSNDLLNI